MPLKKIYSFLIRYKLLDLAFVAIAVGGGLYLSGQHLIANWIMGSVAIIETLPIIKSMWEDLRSGTYGIDILAITAIVTSVILRQDLAAMVVVIMLTGGESLEDYAERRAHSELDALLKGSPQQAHVLRGRKINDVKASAVKVGDKIIIRPGELVPVDSIIIEGSSSFNEASLTGESLPVSHGEGEQILSGSLNGDMLITAKAIRSASESQYQQIVKLVESAQASKAPFVRLADRYSIPFTGAAYILAVAAWVLSGHAIRFLDVIIVATPCPLLLAAPIALISGMSRASKYGIIVKTGSALEKLAEARTVIFDKTGTLTSGNLSLETVKAYPPFDKDKVLTLAASVEQNSAHIIGDAIVNAVKHMKYPLNLVKVKNVKEIPGQGLVASYKGDQIMIGRADFLAKNGVSLAKLPHSQAKTTVLVAVNGTLAGAIFLSDQLREESKQTVADLIKLGIERIVMITGDNRETAETIAKQIGIATVYAETLPGEKLHALDDIQERPAIFVGDGVNDAPVLTGADIGIAMGARGSTAASESADLVIMTDDLNKVAQAVEIAKKTFSIAKQSILSGIALSLVLMAVFASGKFHPVYGAILQEVVDVVVIFNALRAHSIKLAITNGLESKRHLPVAAGHPTP
jgi:heavy metal translocating P-type ATPase